MLEWLKKIRSRARQMVGPDADGGSWRPRSAGKYHLLFDYLEQRYAQTVVLTFAQIEDLLGFTLPVLARSDQAWWAVAATGTGEAHFSDAWTLASRTARPNLKAQTVVFERLP